MGGSGIKASESTLRLRRLGCQTAVGGIYESPRTRPAGEEAGPKLRGLFVTLKRNQTLVIFAEVLKKERPKKNNNVSTDLKYELLYLQVFTVILQKISSLLVHRFFSPIPLKQTFLKHRIYF